MMPAQDLTPAEAAQVAHTALTGLRLDDLAGVSAQLCDFAAGPAVVLIAGVPHTGRGLLAEAVVAARPGVRVDVARLRDVPAYPMWDALMVTTPADRALNQAEESLIRRARGWGCPVVVVVTHPQPDADPAELAATESEIERFRLAPLLDQGQIRWWFLTDTRSAQAPAAHLARLLDAAADQEHDGALRASLRQLISAATDRLAQRLRLRQRELATLDDLQARLPLISVHLAEEAKLVRLAVEDRVRRHHDELYEAAASLSRSALSWISRYGADDWSDVEEPLRTGWRLFLDRIGGVLPEVRDRFRGEIHRVTESITRLETELDVAPGAGFDLAAGWDDVDLRRCLDTLTGVQLDPLFTTLHDLCRRAAEQQRTQREREDSAGGSRHRAIANKISGMARQAMTANPEDVVPATVYDNLDSAVTSKLKVFLDAAVAAAELGAGRDGAAATQMMSARVTAARETVERRHEWGRSYADLVGLSVWAGRA